MNKMSLVKDHKNVLFTTILCFVSTMLFAQNFDYLREAYESIAKGDCDRAQKLYNVYKDVERKSNTELEQQIEDCYDEKKGDITVTVKGIYFVMKFVKGGTFQMGSSEEGEGPRHDVTLGNYYIGETEVTQALWRAVMGNNPSITKGDNVPVHGVNWYDCQEFIQKLNALTGKQFRLPTEAEWEYAARGGAKKIGYIVVEENNSNVLVTALAGVDMPELVGGQPYHLDDMAWYICNSGKVKMSEQEAMIDLLDWENNNDYKAHPVMRKSPNELGLYDMRGNVKEWCKDWHGDYSRTAVRNPQGPQYGNEKVIRGGSWNSTWYGCTVYSRGHKQPDDWSVYDAGLRIVLME